MDKDKAVRVVDQLAAWNVRATVVPLGMHDAAVRLQLDGDREALWDADGASGLEAQVLRDGMLVGYVSELPDSGALPAGHTAWLIATADYDLSPRSGPALARPAGPGGARPPLSTDRRSRTVLRRATRRLGSRLPR